MNNSISKLTVIILSLYAFQSCASITPACSENWYITGYYTPLESDYSGARSTVSVIGHKTLKFPKLFLEDIKTEGWGKTRYDWYLGYYDNEWHKSQHPLDAHDQPLIIGSAATDPKYVSPGSTLTIQSNQSFLKGNQFVATDVGPSIKKYHIDIYAGEGESAKHKTWAITGNKTVCFSI